MNARSIGGRLAKVCVAVLLLAVAADANGQLIARPGEMVVLTAHDSQLDPAVYTFEGVEWDFDGNGSIDAFSSETHQFSVSVDDLLASHGFDYGLNTFDYSERYVFEMCYWTDDFPPQYVCEMVPLWQDGQGMIEIVPEPMGLGLLAVGAFALLGRRGRTA